MTMTEAKPIHIVHLAPVGIDMEVEEGETVLDAAFRQGINLMHGCKHGQCSSCKAVLVEEADHELLKYSNFALNDAEREMGNVLLCRMHVFEDCVVELLNYDEDLLRHAVPVKKFPVTVEGAEALTRDIWKLVVKLDEGQKLKFWAGQYVDITLPERGVTRAFSMANQPSQNDRLEFIIKIFSDGEFSGKLDTDVHVGDALIVKGPFGTCIRREGGEGTMYLIGGGSGMAPLVAILRDLVETRKDQPVRFFYGARTRQDLFYTEEIQSLGEQLDDFEYIPALSEADDDTDWQGEKGFIHEVVSRRMKDEPPNEEDEVYTCGPPVMIAAVTPVLEMNDIDEDNVHYDSFTLTAADD